MTSRAVPPLATNPNPNPNPNQVRECDESSRAAASHEAASQRARAKCDSLGHALAAADASLVAESARADAALAQRNELRVSLAKTSAELEECRRAAAEATARAEAAERRAAIGSEA